VHEAASLGNGPVREVAIEHPQGKMFVRTELIDQDGNVTVKQASQIRHARKLFEGKVFVPASVWSRDREEVVQASRGRRAD
jgi:2-methylaconitate cis-trans-isomerase PrpF